MIPNMEVYPKIKEAAQNGKLVLFVGNGVSMLLGYPSWKEMGNRAIDALYDNKYIEYAEKAGLYELNPKIKLSIFCHYYKKMHGNEKFFDALVKKQESKRAQENSCIYDALYSIGTVFITTNYDGCLDEIAEKQMISFNAGQEGNKLPSHSNVRATATKIYYKKEDLTPSKINMPGTIIHFHGSIKDKESMVLTTSDYLKHYRDPYVIKFLSELFSKKVVLFIGYGLKEEEIVEYVARKSESGQQEEPRHFWLYPRLSKDNAIFKHLEQYFAEHCNVKLIDFNIDKLGHEQLKEVICNWAEVLKKEVKPLNFEEEKKNLGGILHK